VHAPPLVGAGPAAVVSPAHAGMPRVPLLELELPVELELAVEPELPVVELELAVEPELAVVVLDMAVLLAAPPAPPVDDAGSLEPPHCAVPSQQAAARICIVRAGARVVRIMSVKLLVNNVIGQ
jgi:hypothetical protein